ncbi:uncharacterized protein LOC143920574 [Arctopsyche grandis]|uniref:uncharacterized protein LOC143920574 n=1 Tax=Arctopsyche grandis TaxID=121162 RepID=UPI00406D9E4D
MEPSSSKTSGENPEFSLEQRLEYFVTSFVTELESALTSHQDGGIIEKSGKNPEVSTTVPGISQIKKGVDELVKFSQLVFEKPFQVLEKNKSLQYHEIVYGFHKNKDKGRQLFVDIAVDVFESYESQFNGITSKRGPHKAIQRVAKDAAQRFLNSFKIYGESDSEHGFKDKFQKKMRSLKQTFKPQLSPSKSDFELNAQKVIEGRSNTRLGIAPGIQFKPGYDIQYKCKEFGKGCEKIHNDWRTSSLFDKVGVVVKIEDLEDYDVLDRNISKCDKYGYRRLLPDEILNTEYGYTGKCQRTCMHPQYSQNRDFYDSKRTTILKSINENDGVAVNEAKADLENIKDEVQKQGHESRNNVLMLVDNISSKEHRENKLEKLGQTNIHIETTCSGNRDIPHEIEKVKSMITNQKQSNDPILFCITPPVKSFEGRIEELKKIHDALMEKSTAVISRAVFVVGLGGIGKTELSKKYALKYKEYYYNRVFINSEKSETIQNSFKELAKQMKIQISFEEERDSVVTEIYSRLHKSGKTLVIFDNVEEYKDIKPFIFNNSADDNCVHTLITSRCQKWDIGEKGDIKLIYLNKFTEDEAVAYFMKYLKDEDEADLKLLNSLLDGLPLAIWQVVGYINQQNEDSIWEDSEICKVKDYVQLYTEQWKRLLSEGPNGEDNVCEKTIATTWSITMRKFVQIGECGESALSILKIISYLAPHDIDVKKIFLKFEKDEKKLEKAFKLLRDYSMVNVEKGKVSVHRLVQRAVKMYLIEKKEDEKYLLKALKLLEESYFREHIMSVWEYLSNYPQIVKKHYGKSKYCYTKLTPMHLLVCYRNDVTVMVKISKICESDCINCKDIIGRTPLDIATKRENMSLDVVRYLVKTGADVNCKNDSDNTPLHNATEHGDINVIQYLVDNGADVNCKNDDDDTPLHNATKHGDINVITFLLQNGAVVNCKNSNGDIPLYNAIIKGDINVIQYLVENGSDVNCQNKLDDTPLHNAIKHGDINVIKYFVKNGAEVNCQNVFDETPFYFAARNGNEEIVKFLVAKKAKKSNCYKNDTPLDVAVFQGHDMVVDILMSNCNDDDLFYARLKKAARMGDIDKCGEILQTFKVTKPDLFESLFKASDDFHFALKDSTAYITQYLLNCRMNVDKFDKNKNSPLVLAALKNSSIEVFINLLNPGTINEEIETALFYTARNGDEDVFKLLMSKITNLNIRDEANRSLLHWAAEGGNVNILQLLYDNGVRIHTFDKYYETPLFIAVRCSHYEAINYLMKLGASTNLVNQRYETMIHYAAIYCDVDLSELLLSKVKYLGIMLDRAYRSPMHCAAEGGNVKILQLLVDKGVEIDLPDEFGETPLLIAKRRNNSEAINYLIKVGANPNQIIKKT